MAKYQKYAEYKDSEIVWMGNVPSHWTSERFKWLLTEKLKTSNCDLPAGSISFGEVVYKNEDNLSPDTKASYQEVLKDEFLINPLNLNYDLKSLRTALSKINVVVSTGYIVLHCNKSLDKKYVRWLLHEFDVSHMKTLGAGVRQTVNFSDIANCYFYLPTNIEQKKIGEFLDNETAKIDTLIAKQEKLIELLKEKRQAVISHAVTKGLNLNAPMKDSGVEWLGEVPEHWKIFNIQRILNFIEQGSSPVAQNQTPQDDEYGVLKISAVKKGKFFPNESKTLDYKSQLETKYIVHLGDLLVTRANTPQLVADACVVNTEPTSPTMMCDLIYRLNTISDIKKEFLCYWLLSNSGRTQIELDARGSSMTMAKVSQSHIKAWKVVLPPLKEQNDIVIYLDYKLKEIDRLIDKSMVTIKLIQERRTALISAAVTGKVDVRNWQNPNKNNNQDNMELSA
ncbi:restriction endonuclease subunit S [Acinetobacter sp. LF10]|uniref:restriction endonuclease subunit S n=1 Tax=Acinetobacter sp. LF10 TaxID=3403576 RepID=UPI003B21B894